MIFPDNLVKQAETILAEARQKKIRIATAESCTGGLICGLLTEIPGSSDVVDRGYVTYSNRAKEELLGVPPATLAAHGAVSPETAKAMAEGAENRANVEAAVAVTGIAGPDGGTDEKPVGLVYVAVRVAGKTTVKECRFGIRPRAEIRLETVRTALSLLSAALAAAN